MMRFAARWLVLLLLGGSALAQETKSTAPVIPVEEFATRRAGLRKAIPDGVILMEADPLKAGMDNIDENTPVYDFSYLAGYHHEGDILAIDSDGSAVLFAEGKADVLKTSSGIEDIRPRGQLAAFLKEALPKGKKVVTRLREKSKTAVEAIAEGLGADVEAGGRKIQTAITRLRLVKSPAELDMMRKASDATNKAHLEAMKACRPGLNEKQLQKVIEDKFKAEGCDGLGFPSIVGSGMNGTILHYNENKDPIPAESLVVCDIGASYRGYVTDITRTLPTSGKFTDVHKKAYQCVLDAQKAAEGILKPGVTIGQLHQTAGKVFEDRGMTDYSFAHNQWPRGHGIGHQVGMAVHDSDIRGTKLAAGMVVTIEPGYYNWKDGWGIRIEDIYIVTKDGFERMSALPPREVDEIEKMMASK